MRIAIVSLFCCVACVVGLSVGVLVSGPRNALWRVVQACVLDYQITGVPFPCLAVEMPHGRETGYAVLRAPLDGVKIIVTPTVGTIGIEDRRLRGRDAPNYFADAWEARHFATDRLATKPSDDDLALAVNSRPGRSQDQLHIHVACMWPGVKQALDREAANVYAQTWVRLKVLPRAPYYLAHFEPGRDLSKINVIDLASEGLKIQPQDLDGMTIVVAGTSASAGRPAGFTILARKRNTARDEPHGEALLDQTCKIMEGS